MKKVIVIIMTILSILLIATGILISINIKENTNPEDNIKEENEVRTTTLEEITTPDQIVKFKSTEISYRDKVSQLTITMISNIDYEELYLKVDFNLKEKETHMIKFQEVKANEEYQYIIQSSKDLTKSTSWNITQITKEEFDNKNTLK